MRVYEFSKQYNIPSKDIISALQSEGIDIKSHMSAIDEQAMVFLKKKFKSNFEVQKKDNEEVTNIKAMPERLPVKSQDISKVANIAANEIDMALKKDTPVSVVAKEMTIADFARETGIVVHDIILTLLRMGIVASKNKMVSQHTIGLLAKHYGIEIKSSSLSKEPEKKGEAPQGDHLKERLPIVVILGHVDHGKTTLLDFIRHSRVAAREKGGITQHIGAYEATTAHGNIVFLDTPGHEAFSKMRRRGIRIADIAVLVVAADDGVMPQTVEAIKHALSMNIPLLVAINKVDKVNSSRIEIVKRELSQHGVVPEEWGGDVVCIPISAKTGIGVETLLEMIVLQAQLMELRATDEGACRGVVVESGIEKGYGQVATVISHNGAVEVGDFFKAGSAVGKVSSIIDSHGNRLKKAGPSIPVRVSGFESLPRAGDSFECINKSEYLVLKNTRKDRLDIAHHYGAEKEDTLNFIIKTDTNSSKEALIDAIAHLSRKMDRGINILLANVGGITESDVELACNANAQIIGLHVKAEPNAALLAHQKKVTIHLFDVIYKLLESLEMWTQKAAPVKKVFTKIGEATVLRVFDIKGVGMIAGSYVKEGRFVSGGQVRIFRNNRKIGEGTIKSLQRDKKPVKEVHAAFECGFMVEGFRDWAPDDKVECLIELPVK